MCNVKIFIRDLIQSCFIDFFQSCVQSGEFTHSDPRRPDTLSDKQLRLLVLQRRTQDLEKKILAENEAPGQLQLTLREQIKMTQQRIKYFDHLIKEKRAKVKKMREVCQNLVSVRSVSTDCPTSS